MEFPIEGLWLALSLALCVTTMAETAIADAGEHRTLQILLEKGVITQAEYDEAAAAEQADEEEAKAREKAEKQATEQANWLTKRGLKVKLGGFAEVDFIGDETRSFTEIIGNRPVLRNGSLAGSNGQFQTTPRNSRITLDVQAPEVSGLKTRYFASMDFLGNQPQIGNDGVSEFSSYTSPTPRIFQLYFQVHSPYADVKVGQDWSAFGFMSQYSRGQVSIAALPANMFNRWIQASVTHAFPLSSQWTLTPIFSIERPPQRDAEMPSFVGGFQVAYSGWQAPYTGSSSGDAAIRSLSFQLSGVGRRLEANAGGQTRVSDQDDVDGWGVSAGLFLPLLPSKDGKLGNTAHLVMEGATGAGISDFFTGLSFGVCNPVCGNSSTNSGFGGDAFGQTNIDSGLAAVSSRSGKFEAIRLSSWMVHATYYFPDDGKTWAGGGFGSIYSTNADEMTCSVSAPYCGGAVRSLASLYRRESTWYGYIFHDFTPEIRVGLETDWVRTTYADDAHATNRRIQASLFYRF